MSCTGTPSVVVETPLLEPGQYVDTLPAKEKQGATTERYYRIAPEPGWTPHVTVTGVVAPDAKRSSVAATVSLEVEALGPDGKRGPIVLVFDDLHDAHDESLDLLGHLVDTLDAPILLLCLARPDMIAHREDWRRHGGSRHRIVELSPLSETDSARVMEELLAPCGEVEGVEELVESAVTLAGGNPALLERTVRIFLDLGVIEVEDEFAEIERWRVHIDRLANVKLPLTVEDAIQALVGHPGADVERSVESDGELGQRSTFRLTLGHQRARERSARSPSAQIDSGLLFL